MAFSLLTFNVFFSEHEFPSRFAAQLELFRASSAHVICLQEVTSRFTAALQQASQSPEHSAWLSAYAWSGCPLSPSVWYGTGALVLKSLSPGFSRLPLPTDMGRDLLLISVAPQPACPVLIGCVHLESMENPELRRQQLQDCAEALQSSACAVLCGDFNFCSTWSFKAMQKAGCFPAPEAAAASGSSSSSSSSGSSAGSAPLQGPPAEQEGSEQPAPFSLRLPASVFRSGSPVPPLSQRESLQPPALRSSCSSSSRQPRPLENAALAELLPLFTDAWPALHPDPAAEPGFTFDSTVNSMLSKYEQMRYDRVLFKLPGWGLQSIRLLGTQPVQKQGAGGAEACSSSSSSSGFATPTKRPAPLFASDHFAVLATFELPPR